MPPSHRSTVSLVLEKSHSTSIETTMVRMSMMLMPLICIGQMTAVEPRMARVLNTLLPMTLPMAMAELPFFAATTLVANSGSEVPPATMVRPTMLSLMPSVSAT